MNAPIAPEEVVAVEFSLNGVTVGARPGETLIQVADRLEVPIPRLCYKPGMPIAASAKPSNIEASVFHGEPLPIPMKLQNVSR